MDINAARLLIQPFVEFFSALLLSGVTVTLATQLLKSNYIPLPAQKYPRVVAGIASALGTLAALYLSNLHLLLNNLFEYAAFGVGVFLISVFTYNHVVKTLSTSNKVITLAETVDECQAPKVA